MASEARAIAEAAVSRASSSCSSRFGRFFLQKLKLFLLHLKCLAQFLHFSCNFRAGLSVSLSVNQQMQFRW